MDGALSIVATPIGNLEDITLRAVRVLREADCVLCEDTRVTKKLLAHYGIETSVMSYHAKSGGAKVEKILELLREGRHLALVSDAGTPCISDPGSRLVDRIRYECADDVRIEAVPGPSAVTAALSIAGVPASEFLFLGFLPHKKGRTTLFSEITISKRTVVFYESPHRILKTLERLALGLGDRTILIIKEITKIHEHVFRDSAENIRALIESDPRLGRGEFVVVVPPAGGVQHQGLVRK